MSTHDSVDFDETKLSGDDGDIYMLHWLVRAENDLQSSEPSGFKTSQAIYESKILKLVSSVSPYPQAGRPFRNLAAKCLVLLYTRGDTRTLFDTMQTLVKIIVDQKESESKRISAFHCIGELMVAVGTHVMSFMGEIAVVSVKTFRNTSNSLALRYQAITALRKSLVTAGKALTDTLMKDIIKQSRTALADKCVIIQRAAAEILIILFPIDDGTRSVSDVESLLVICTRNLEAADQETRRSLSRLVGHLLASTQTLRSLPSPDPQRSKKKNKDETSGDNNTDGLSGSSALNAAEASKPILTPAEMLSLLSVQYNKSQFSSLRKSRIVFFDFYCAVFTVLGTSFVEANYPVILKHFFTEIIPRLGPSTAQGRDDGPIMIKLISIILRDLVGVRYLTEQGQIAAIQELSKSYLKKWPALMPGQNAPESVVLKIALKEVAGLVRQLGNAPPPVQDALGDPLVRLLSHSDHGTRVAAAWALRNFCFATPNAIAKIILKVLDLLQRDTSSLSVPPSSKSSSLALSFPYDIAERANGHAYGLSTLIAVIPARPLYVSADLPSKVFDIATQLLRNAGEHAMPIASIEIEISWMLIASLMSLGPHFVRAHLPQLMVLWRNALPKPSTRESSQSEGGRGDDEWIFLLNVRAGALTAVFGFLKHNATLVTLDISRRISILLFNGLDFTNAFVAAQQSKNTGLPGSDGAPQIDDRTASSEANLRRRVYQCFTLLGIGGITDSRQVSLLQSTVSIFAGLDFNGSALQAAIATSSGNFTSLWQCGDGYAYGVTSIGIEEEKREEEVSEITSHRGKDSLNRDAIEAEIDELINKPIIGSCEHDVLALCSIQSSDWPEPPPVLTAVVDAALELFAALLSIQDAQSASRIVADAIDATRSPKLEKNAGRRAAVNVNVSLGMVLALRMAMLKGSEKKEVFGNEKVQNRMAEFLKDTLISSDPILRAISSEAIGRLASLSDTTFLTSQVKLLVDQVVSNRDPSARAGCALAFGAVYTHVGGLAAGPLLKTTINILMSLGNDAHPLVHYYALSALAQVVNAASLAYAPFVSSTLGMLLKVYLMESHEPEGGTLINANMKGGYPLYQVVCRLLDAIVAVLGPDLQESERTRNLVLDLHHVLLLESDEGVCVEVIRCMQHLLMFTPGHVDVPSLLSILRAHLASPRRPLKFAAITALYQLVQRDALSVSRLGGDKLVEELFGMLDRDPSIAGVRDVIMTWLEQTVVLNPNAWIDLCQRIMSRTTASQQASDPSSTNFGGLADDEGQSLNTNSMAEGSSQTALTSRWRTQLFALQCLHRICRIVSESGRREHFDIPFARAQKIPTSTLLVSRVSDLIKMAFTASAAYVTEIRLEGLRVLRDVIEVFSKSPDPDFGDSLLLEQYQAPIAAALTPAFSSDSSPEILSSAVQVCAVFVGSGIIKDANRMGRILKLLTTALEQSRQSGMITLGKMDELSPNASVMLRISILAAWAELEVSAITQEYLKDVVDPYRKTLLSLWVSSLRDYASIKGESEVFQDSGSMTTEAPYASLGREILLPYYESSWAVILHAVATEMKIGEPQVFLVMDGLDLDADSTNTNVVERAEPTTLFFAVFGLIYEALAVSSADATPSARVRQNAFIALEALKYLVKPGFSGRALLDSPTLNEFMSLCYRMAMTESAATQVHLVQAITSFAVTQAPNINNLADINGTIADTRSLLQSHSPLTSCIRICAHILRNSIAGSGNARTFSSDPPADRIELVRVSFKAFSDIGQTFGPRLVEETRAVAASLYAELLRDEKSDVDIVGPTLSSLKIILDNPPLKSDAEATSRYGRLIHGIFSSCIINIDEMSGRRGLISRRKITNNLLAAVLILTVVPSYVGFSDKALEYFFSLISQKLLDREVSLTAAHCAKTIILSGSSGNVVLKRYTRVLFGGIVEYLVSVASLGNDEQGHEETIRSVDEVFKACSGFFASIPVEKHGKALGFLLPSVTLLLDDTTVSNSKLHMLAVTQALDYARLSPSAFKEATEKMDTATRIILETSVRRALGAHTSATPQNTAKPQISLKSF